MAALADDASLLELAGVEARPGGSLVAVFIDGRARRLTELAWTPGVALALRSVALSAEAIDFPAASSLGAGRVMLSCIDRPVQLIDRRTGKVEEPGRAPAIAVVTPDGRHAVAAGDDGLSRHGIACPGGGPGTVPRVGPLHAMDLDDPSSLAIVPGDAEGHFSVVAGCYGALAIVRVAAFGLDSEQLSGHLVHTAPLPYDPVRIVRPVPPVDGPGARIFVTDQGRAGLMAVSLTPGFVDRCPLADRGYGAIRHVVPRLDGRECLVLTRDDTWRRWLPGAQVLKPMAELGGWPVLWHGAQGIVLDHERGLVREVALA